MTRISFSTTVGDNGFARKLLWLKDFPLADLTTCPSCNKDVSPKAYDCPHCGHPIRKPKRGFFGKLFKWTFILFNGLMLIWLISYFAQLGELSEDLNTDAERAGAAIGGTIGTSMIMTVWVIGDVILGLFTLFTRPSK